MNTTRIPHRSIYTPDHTNFALDILRKYHTTTDNYLGLLGLTFRENQLTEGLDTAPLYEYVVHLHLQLQQLKHESNTFIGSRLNTMQLLQKKWIANAEYIQANKKLIYNSNSPNSMNRSEHLLQTSIVNLKEAFTFSVIQNKLTWRLVDHNIASNAAYLHALSILNTNAVTRRFDINQQMKQANITDTVIQNESMPFNTIQQLSASVNTSSSRSSLAERTLQLHINRLKAFTIWNPVNQIRNFGTKTILNNILNAHFAKNDQQEEYRQNYIAQRLLLIDRKQQDRQFITIYPDTKPNRINLYKQYNAVLKASWTMDGVTEQQHGASEASNHVNPTEHNNVIHQIIIDQKLINRGFSFITENTNLEQKTANQLFANYELNANIANANVSFLNYLRLKQTTIRNNDINTTVFVDIPTVRLIDRKQIERGLITKLAEERIPNQGLSTLNQHSLAHEITTIGNHFPNYLRLKQTTISNNGNNTFFEELPVVLLIDRKQIERGLITTLTKESVLNHTQNIRNQQSLTSRSTISNDNFLDYLMVKQTDIQNRENDSFIENRPVVLLIDRKQVERGLITKSAEERIPNQGLSSLNRHSLAHEFTTIGNQFGNYLRLKQTTISNNGNNTSFEELPAVLLIDRKQIERGLTTALAKESTLLQMQNTSTNVPHEMRRLGNIAAKEYIKSVSSIYIDYKAMIRNRASSNVLKSTANDQVFRPQLNLLERLVNTSLSSIIMQRISIKHKFNSKQTHILNGTVKDTILTNNQYESDNGLIIENSLPKENLTEQIVRERIDYWSSLVQLLPNIVHNHLLKNVNNALDVPLELSQSIATAINHRQSLMLVDRRIINQEQYNAVQNNLAPILAHLQLRTINTFKAFNTSDKVTYMLKELKQLSHVSHLQSASTVSQTSHITRLLHNQFNYAMMQQLSHAASFDHMYLHEKIVRERIGELAAFMEYLPIHAMVKYSNQVALRLTPELQDIELNKSNFQTLNSHQNQENIGPILSIQTSLTPIIYQKYGQSRIENDWISNEYNWSLIDRRLIDRGDTANIHNILLQMRQFKYQLKEIKHYQDIQLNISRSFTEQLKSRHSVNNLIHTFNQFSNTILAEKSKTLVRTNDLTNSVGASDAMGFLYYQSNLTNHIVNERLGNMTNVLQLLPIHTTNSLLQPSQEGAVGELAQHANAYKEFSSLKLVDRSFIARGILSAVTVIMQKPKFKQQPHQGETSGGRTELHKEARPVIIRPKQLQNVIQLNERRTKLAVKGPVMTYLSSLSPIIYQRFASKKKQNTPPKQINRVLDQTASSVTQLPAQNYESLTTKIFQDRVNELTSIMQLMTLTNLTTIANPVQMNTAAQQEFDRQIERQIAIASEKKPGLVLVDRNRIEQNLLETVTVVLEKQMNPNLIKPDIITDRTHRKLALNETMTTINDETYLLNRRIQKEAAAGNQIVKASISETTAALDYLKTKPAGPAETNQSSSTALSIAAHNQPEIKIDKSELNAAQFPKQEFDKIVDKVFKEIQKRFTFERQRRGM